MIVLDKIFSRTADAVFAIDANGCVVYANNSFSNLSNQTFVKIQGQPCHKVLNCTTLSGGKFCGPECPVRRALPHQSLIKNFDLMIPQNNGNDVWVNVGVLFAPETWKPARMVFMVRPFNMTNILDRFVNTKVAIKANKKNGLTHREEQIVTLLAQGYTDQLIADHLHICRTTVRNHTHNIYSKLHVHSRAEVVSYAYKNGLV